MACILIDYWVHRCIYLISKHSREQLSWTKCVSSCEHSQQLTFCSSDLPVLARLAQTDKLSVITAQIAYNVIRLSIFLFFCCITSFPQSPVTNALGTSNGPRPGVWGPLFCKTH